MSESKSKSRPSSKSKDREKDDKKDKKSEKSEKSDKKDKKSKDKEEQPSEPASPARKSRLSLNTPESQAENQKFVLPLASSKLCIHHQLPMAFFCDSCQEPVCNQCTVIGPHNNQLHRLQDLKIAFNTQSQNFQAIMRLNLVPKRDQLAAQIYRLDYRVGEIKSVKTWIERDIRTEFEGMLETLRSMEGTKDVMLRHEVELLRRDIDKIDELLHMFSASTQDPNDPLEFLTKYAYVRDLVQFIMGKDFKRSIDIVATDFPNELPKRKETLEKAKLFEQVSAFKDKVIAELVSKSEKRLEQIREEYDEAAADEVQEWASLTDTLSQRLKKFKTICYYCGCSLNEANVNSVCRANKKSYYPLGFGYTVDLPENDWHKTARHFFGKPRPDLVKKDRSGSPSPLKGGDDEFLRRSPLRNREARVPYQTFLDVIFTKISKQCRDKEINFEDLVQSFDSKREGNVSFISLSYLLNEYCALDPIDLEKLKEVVDPLNQNIVYYNDFLEMYQDFQNQERI